MSYETLKARHRQERDAQPESLRLRIHRALSWLERAEKAGDPDARFIFLWIAFNAAYAQEIENDDRLSEQITFKVFLEKLCSLDREKRINTLVWKAFPGSIRILLDNPYVFMAFWDFQRGKIDQATWQSKFDGGKKAAQRALASSDTPALLGLIFHRIYALRNQLVHGGATWNGRTNREQLRDCVNLMEKLVPLVIELMMDNPGTLWGEVCFPVVRD